MTATPTALVEAPRQPVAAAGEVTTASGLYAWWADPSVLPGFAGSMHPDGQARLLYVGKASSLRTRITRNHLRSSRTSTLRRTLAGLLMDDHGWTTSRRGERSQVVLDPPGEQELTAWMTAALTFTVMAAADPAAAEDEALQAFVPPLNVRGVPDSPTRRTIEQARARYLSST